MATTFTKRNKEKLRQERQKDKELKRRERKQARDNRAPAEPGVDPDIADIVPGPQPIEEA
jgi:hypothetical protein